MNKAPFSFHPWELLLLGGLVSLIAILAITPISNNDLFWQLRTGQEILSTRTIPRVDSYSVSASGTPWTNHEWLAEVIFALVYGFSGFNGLILLKFFLILLSFFILYAYAKREGAHPLFLVILALPVLFASAGRFIERPHIFSLVFLSLHMIILLDIKPGRRAYKLCLLPLIQLFWANLHGAFLIGIALPVIFFAAHAADLLFRRLKGERLALLPRPLPLLALVALINPVVSLMNPFGYHALTYLLRLDQSDIFLDSVYEWLSPFSKSFREGYLFLFYLAWLGVCLIAFLLQKGRIPLHRLLPFLVLLYLSVKMNRNLDLFCFGTYPIIAGWLKPVGDYFAEKFRARAAPAGAAAAILLIALVAIDLALGIRGFPLDAETRKSFGFGISSNRADHAAHFIREKGIRGRAFNAYGFGGDLIFWCYPDTHVIMDSRNLVYGKTLFREYRRALQGWRHLERMLDQYDIDFMLLQYPRGQYEEEVHRKIWESDAWRLVYFDDAALLYLRNSPSYRTLILTYEYRCLNPIFFETGGLDPSRSSCYLEESMRAIKISPQSAVCLNILIRLMLVSGRYAEALTENQSLSHLENGRYRAFVNEGLAYFLRKEYDSAEAAFRKALKENPDAREPANYLDRIKEITP